MTLEEARQLKPGDYVSAVFVIRAQNSDSIIDEDGELKLVAVEDNGHISTRRMSFLAPECVQKTERPRRKFKKGDIVRTHRGYVFFAIKDEDEDGDVSVEQSEESDAGRFAKAENLTLLLAVENRKDRKDGE